MDELTARFYRDKASAYALATREISMATCYARFERHLRPGAHILDVGAGSGRDLRYFRQAGYRVTGIDSSKKMAAQAARYAGAPVYVGTVETLETVQGQDGIWANAVLHHLPPPVLAIAFRRLARALKVGGVLFVSFRCGEAQFRHADGRLYYGMDRARLLACVAGLGLWPIDQWEEGDRTENGASANWSYTILRRL